MNSTVHACVLRLIWAMAGTISLSASSFAQVQFPVSFDASASNLTSIERTQITSHVQAAGADWIQYVLINGSRSIEVEIGIDDAIATGNGGSATSGFVGVNVRDTFEQGAAAELRTGVDPNGATVDVRFKFNTNYLRNELWLDPNPTLRIDPVPVNRTDAMSVFLHEFGHAFAYNGFNDLNSGLPQPAFWSTFDQWIIPRPSLAARNLFSGPRARAVFGTNPDLTTGNIFHWANSALLQQAVLENGGEPISMDADQAAVLRTNEVSSALIDELMNGVVFVRGSRYRISALDRAVLDDVGIATKLFASGFE
jgi:hypothetical protein